MADAILRCAIYRRNLGVGCVNVFHWRVKIGSPDDLAPSALPGPQLHRWLRNCAPIVLSPYTHGRFEWRWMTGPRAGTDIWAEFSDHIIPYLASLVPVQLSVLWHIGTGASATPRAGRKYIPGSPMSYTANGATWQTGPFSGPLYLAMLQSTISHNAITNVLGGVADIWPVVCREGPPIVYADWATVTMRNYYACIKRRRKNQSPALP